MMKFSKLGVVFSVALVCGAQAQVAPQVKPHKSQSQICVKPSYFPGLVGGWTEEKVNPKIIEMAKKFIVRENLGTFDKVLCAEKQLVAGMNYRITVRLQSQQCWQLTIYKNLDGVEVLSKKEQVRH